MTGIVLDAQQIQNAPAPVRLWLEQQISAALGPRPAPGASSPRLVACTEAQAANLLDRIRQAPSVVKVFFGLAHPEISFGEPPVVTFRLLDLQRRAGLENITKLLECLGLINQAFAEMCDDPAARFCDFDAAGHCSILPTTQSSIAALWKAIIAAERPGVLPIAAAE
ncbi:MULTISPECIES: hypothetical protein [Bradyrhizobium]|uniref:Uncharacterized protein n=1 Tax=Bradyrhizobium elkanii TaxID=29448 RepID=A0A1E3EVW7_BRAEL|nr:MULTISPECIES: hypothetical protein [Bradyrhizobium]MBP1293896.1 hypothetical protein [Bradyrhizobium elkanii]MCP1925520.1 hypothetical protein [Bradyrhizobium elkanii]MCS3476987.1 hypothetical protein [Bradyrhizobium elkanii]MCS3583725.1 hypothetical protein [Bradyrhizobium elkanii]MCS3717295.1 hypothetical protein [Bradyrhizobium elkanii]